MIELYINNRLCDTGRDFSVRLNRQLLNPRELNAKDAQYSFSITLPPTSNNHTVFNYANIEETKDKFNIEYKAELIINSVRVFIGLFRLSEVTRTRYKGNLYIPAPKSIKDIFGDTKLNENAEFRIPFKDFAEYISYYNTQAATSPQMAIFPYTLYGVLPKVPALNGSYSSRNLWDDSVRMGLRDMPPSINPLLMLRHIFDSHGYKLGGSAFDDERLTNLYMSYKNDTGYVQPWNYGHHAIMRIRGAWSNVYNYTKFERSWDRVDRDGEVYYSGDLLDSTNVEIDVLEDPGANILLTRVNDTGGEAWTRCRVSIPASGYYKVRLKSDIKINTRKNWRSKDQKGIQYVGGDASNDNRANSFRKKRYEVKVLRDWGKGEFGLANSRINRTYFGDNLRQNGVWDEENTPKYFPKPDPALTTEVMFVDPAENPNFVLGMGWGRRIHSGNDNPLIDNPAETDYGTVMLAKTGLSWDTRMDSDKTAKAGMSSPGYMKWGILGEYDDEGEDPDKNIDFSGGDWRNDVELDASGNITPLPAGDTSIVLYRFKLDNDSQCNLSVPTGAGYAGKIYLHRLASSTTPDKVYDFDAGGTVSFDPLPSAWPSNTGTYLTLYLARTDAALNFDVSVSLVIKRIYDPEDIIGWEESKKFKIEVNNAPISQSRRGWYKGVYVNRDWYGSGDASAVVWLEAGEIITVVSSSDEGRYKQHNSSGKYGWTVHDIDFELEIHPFRVDEDWLKVNSAGNGTAVMDWNDPVNFDTDTINLVGFLTVDMKTDDFIENFCKAFNLQLTQTDMATFALNVRQTKTAVSNLFINLDNLASVRDRSNTPLGLPSLYRVGFTVDRDEEGFVTTDEDGGGEYSTGVTEEKTVDQKSSFSYNWFKDISKEGVMLPLAVISKADVWDTGMSYSDSMKKKYTNQALRFWYPDGLLNDLGVSFEFNKKPLSIIRVSGELPGLSVLNYKNKRLTILDNYFTLLIHGSSHYTEIEGYLTPVQYEALNGAIMAMFNGDLYYVAELTGYDPQGRNKTKIKLIRRI